MRAMDPVMAIPRLARRRQRRALIPQSLEMAANLGASVADGVDDAAGAEAAVNADSNGVVNALSVLLSLDSRVP
jgi:hypothetical protein